MLAESSSSVAASIIPAVLVITLGLGLAACTDSHSPTTSAATLEGPITVGQESPPFDPRGLDVAKLGYVEHEWFVSGTATRYAEESDRTSDGRWRITPDGTAPYKTRIVVRMPADPTKFNGVVILEWLNVSATELSPDWAY